MAIDYGKVRTGLAVTDPEKIIATGLCTVQTDKLFSFLSDYCANESVECMVVGEPKHLAGTSSDISGEINLVIEKIKISFPKIKIERMDERYTSKMASATILNSGLKKMSRRNKALVDKVSAVIILQDYMTYISKS